MISEAEYKAGDTVTLKTGGPEMTITATNEMARIAFCKWFSDGSLQEGEFPFQGLRRPDTAPSFSKSSIRPAPIFGILAIILPAIAVAITIAIAIANASAAFAKSRHTIALIQGHSELFTGITVGGILFLIFGVAALARKEQKRWLVSVALAVFIGLVIIGGIVTR